MYGIYGLKLFNSFFQKIDLIIQFKYKYKVITDKYEPPS